MLTFEKVLEVFKEYLDKDEICEVVLTRRGYTVMFWEEKAKEWYGVEYCETPKDLRDAIASGMRELESFGLTKARRELTEEDLKIVETEIQKLIDKCEE